MRKLFLLFTLILISIILSCSADDIGLSLSADPSQRVTQGETITVLADGTFSDFAVHWYIDGSHNLDCQRSRTCSFTYHSPVSIQIKVKVKAGENKQPGASSGFFNELVGGFTNIYTEEQLDVNEQIRLYWDEQTTTSTTPTTTTTTLPRFVAAGDSGVVGYSVDGTSWSGSHHSNGAMQSIAYGNGVFVAVGTVGVASYSSDGISWTTSNHNNSNIIDVAYGNGRFVAAGLGGVASYSSDGTSWTTSNHNNGAIYGIAYGNGRFVAVGSGGVASYSTDGTSWAASNHGIGNLHGIVFHNFE